MKLVNKDDLKYATGRRVVGPIAEGETPHQAAMRMGIQFKMVVEQYAYKMHEEPLRGRNQQFSVIVGTLWADAHLAFVPKEKK